jgi:hypothetical protein
MLSRLVELPQELILTVLVELPPEHIRILVKYDKKILKTWKSQSQKQLLGYVERNTTIITVVRNVISGLPGLSDPDVTIKTTTFGRREKIVANLFNDSVSIISIKGVVIDMTGCFSRIVGRSEYIRGCQIDPETILIRWNQMEDPYYKERVFSVKLGKDVLIRALFSSNDVACHLKIPPKGPREMER